MSLPQPTKARFRRVNLAGVDLLQHVSRLKVYETIQKPYKTATLQIIDNHNLLNNMGLVGGEPCSFAFDAGDGLVYGDTMYVLSVHGEASAQSLRSQIYTVELIGDTYFKDKTNLVQQSFHSVPGTQAIQQIHSQFLGGSLRVLAQSLGPIASANNSYIVSAQKPFKAINDIRKRLTYGGVDSGTTLYFRDRDSHVLAPLEQLFAQMGSQETFYQEATWGKDWFDVVKAQFSIIACRTEVDPDQTGRTGMSAIAGNASQEKKVFDFRIKDLAVNKAASAISGGAQAAASILGGGGKHGAQPNYMTMDSDRLPASTDPSVKTERERLYQALARNGPSYTIKVPIQGGINCTVGKGVTAHLLPPTGDMDTGTNMVTGQFLVGDLCHDLAADDRMVNGTTTMRITRDGF